MGTWDLWVDYHRSYSEGLVHTRARDAEPGVEVVEGAYVVVGNEEADPSVAEIVSVEPDGVVLLRVLRGPVSDHLHLVGGRSVS